MKKSVLVCGSYAFDTIMLFEDRFKNHILPDKAHILNISFHTPKMRKEFGGCAGNISYNLNLLGIRALPVATVGKDFATYKTRLDALKIESKYIKVIDNIYTAQAFITTDMDGNQITSFHPGAMDSVHFNDIKILKLVANLGIIAPESKRAMIQHAATMEDFNIPFIFDPGQGTPLFNKTELIALIDKASWMVVNDYELGLVQKLTKLSLAELSSAVKALIITKGAKGSDIHYANKVIHIDAIKCISKDPTGSGDAYRAGLIYGLIHRLDWQITGNLANLIGAIKVGHLGTQNHFFSLGEIKKLYFEHYQTPLP